LREVYFYGTCLVDLFFPDAGMAGIQLLRQAGVKVIFPESQTCCGQPDEALVRAFSARVYELTQFLVDVLDVRLKDLGEPVKVTWHSSCHAVRELGLKGEPQALIGQLANVELAPLAREQECCGFGGTFSVRQPEISGVMACDKALDAESTGATVLLSTDGGCLLNVNGTLEAKKSSLRVQHIAEFLWERTHAR